MGLLDPPSLTSSAARRAFAQSGDHTRLAAIRASYSATLGLPYPLLDLNYADRMALYGVETFTRSTTDTYTDLAGISQTAAIDTAAFDRISKSGSLVPVGLKCNATGTAMATFNPATLLGTLPANEYTIVLDIERPSSFTGAGAIFSLDGGSITNRIEIGVNTPNYQPYVVVQTGGSVALNQTLGAMQVWYGGPRRVVLVVKSNAFTFAFDGISYNTTSSGTAPTRSNLTNLRVGGNGYGASFFTGWVKRARILPVALTQTQAVDLSAGDTPLACWGDSLTAGTGATGQSGVYTEVLRALTVPTVGVYNGGVGGDTSTQIRTRALADTMRNRWTSVIWAGRNNPSVPGTVVADVQAIVGNLTHDRYLVLSVINRSDGTEGPGSTQYNQIVACNAALAAAFPNNYLDIRSLIVAASSGPGDAPASGWTADGLHLNNTGYAYVAGQVGTYLRSRGWF